MLRCRLSYRPLIYDGMPLIDLRDKSRDGHASRSSLTYHLQRRSPPMLIDPEVTSPSVIQQHDAPLHTKTKELRHKKQDTSILFNTIHHVIASPQVTNAYAPNGQPRNQSNDPCRDENETGERNVYSAIHV